VGDSPSIRTRPEPERRWQRRRPVPSPPRRPPAATKSVRLTSLPHRIEQTKSRSRCRAGQRSRETPCAEAAATVKVDQLGHPPAGDRHPTDADGQQGGPRRREGPIERPAAGEQQPAGVSHAAGGGGSRQRKKRVRSAKGVLINKLKERFDKRARVRQKAPPQAGMGGLASSRPCFELVAPAQTIAKPALGTRSIRSWCTLGDAQWP